jgi:hypothetical protein
MGTDYDDEGLRVAAQGALRQSSIEFDDIGCSLRFLDKEPQQRAGPG